MGAFIEIKINIKNLVTLLYGKIDYFYEKCNVFGTFFIPCIN